MAEENPGECTKGEITNSSGQNAIGHHINQTNVAVEAGAIIVLQGYSTLANASRLHVPPAARETLFGRDQELETITATLREGRTVLLYGLGGIGKSALAAKAAEQLHAAHTFEDGVIWINGIGSAPLSSVCDALARQLADEDIPKLAPEAKPDAIRTLLATRRILLVLDDVAASETIVEFLQVCRPPGMPILATSRHHHTVCDEDIALHPLPDIDSQALFRAEVRQPTANGVVGDICKLLGHHPLALVIAAGRARVEGMPLKSIHTRLASPQRLQWLQHVGVNSKDASVFISLNLSYEGLTDDDRRVFTTLAAAFAATTTLELLADACDLSLLDCEDHVGRLVSRSLIGREGDRVSLHQLVQDFGRLLLSDELAAAQDCVSKAAVEYAERYKDETPDRYDRLEADLGNLLGAVRYAMAKQAWHEAIRFVYRLRGVLDVRGHWAELIILGSLGIQAAEHADDEQAIAGMAHNHGVTLQNQGIYEEARWCYEQSLDLKVRLGDEVGIAKSVHQLGILAQEQGDYVEARWCYEQSLEIKVRLGDQLGIASSVHELGNLAYIQGNYEEARGRYEQSLDLEVRLGNQAGIASSLGQLGILAQEQGNYEEARGCYEQSLEIMDRLGDQLGIASSLHNLGNLAFLQGEYEEARGCYEQSLEIKVRLGDQLGIAKSVHQLGILAQEQGDYVEARGCYEQSLEIKVRLGDQLGIASSVHQLGILTHQQGNYEEARELFNRALTIFERMQAPNAEVARKNIAKLEATSSRPARPSQ